MYGLWEADGAGYRLRLSVPVVQAGIADRDAQDVWPVWTKMEV